MNFIRRIRLLAFMVLVAFAAFAFAYWLFAKNDVPINESLYERLALGMTAQEVDRAIGYAPGDYSGAYVYTTTMPMQEGELPLLGTDLCDYANGRVSAPHPATGRQISGKLWRGKEGLLMVFFGEDNRVIERRFYPGYGRTWLMDSSCQLYAERRGAPKARPRDGRPVRCCGEILENLENWRS